MCAVAERGTDEIQERGGGALSGGLKEITEKVMPRL